MARVLNFHKCLKTFCLDKIRLKEIFLNILKNFDQNLRRMCCEKPKSWAAEDVATLRERRSFFLVIHFGGSRSGGVLLIQFANPATPLMMGVFTILVRGPFHTASLRLLQIVYSWVTNSRSPQMTMTAAGGLRLRSWALAFPFYPRCREGFWRKKCLR